MRNEFEIAGHRYRFDGMPAQLETRITRRLMPLMADALPLVLAPGAQIAIRSDLDVVTVAKAVLGGWGALSDDSVDFVERVTLGSLSRETGGQWLSVWPKGDAEPAFADIDGAVMQTAMGRVLGFIVKKWMDGGGEALPAEIRAVMTKLH